MKQTTKRTESSRGGDLSLKPTREPSSDLHQEGAIAGERERERERDRETERERERDRERDRERERERERETERERERSLIDRNPRKHMQTNSVNRRNSESESESQAENTMYRTYCKKEAAGNWHTLSAPRCQVLAV